VAASDPPGGGASRSDRRWQQQWLHKSAKKLSEAACTGNPVHAVGGLAEEYRAECEKGLKQAGLAEMLRQACQALAEGKNPASIAPAPG